jgi:hypothetical protein
MPFVIIDGSGPVLSVKISGELERSEVSQIQAAALQSIGRWEKIDALFVLDDFQGWKRSEEWGDVTFMVEHGKQIHKIAVVGEEKWRDMIYAFLAKGFRDAEIEYFLPADLSKARSWLGTP